MEHKHVTGTRIVEEEIEKENGADSENGGKNDNSVQENGASCEESQCNGNGFLDIPLSKTGHRLSIMEEESVKEKMRVSLLKQCAAILKQGGEKYTKESLHRIFQDRDLLERVFHLFDAERRGRLEQADWVEFLKERLTDDRQLEFVESLETAAFAQRGAGPLHAADFGNLFRSRQVTDRMFRVLDRSGDGVTTAEDIMELLSGVTCSRPRSGYDKSCVDRLEALFRATVGDQREITKEQFKSIMESKNPFFTERVFQIFDEDNSGSISLQEFIAQAHRFAGRAPDQKIQFLFKVYDMDDDGLIQHRELQHVMRACMEENGMRFSEDQLQELTAAMFEDADAARRGAITYEALKEQLERHDGLLENLTISIDRWLVPPKKEEVPPTFTQRLGRLKPYWCSRQYFKNNYVFVGYLLVYFLVNLGLFVSRAVEYREANGYVIVARACGQCLNLTGSWLLVLMLRRGVTWLRARRAGALLPLDHHVYLHKLTGIHLAVYSLVHTGAHLANFSFVVVPDPVLNPGNHTTLEWLFTARPGRFGAVPGCANPTGAALAVILAVMVVFSRPAVRRGGSFEVFYWTHLLYVPFWLLLLFHGPNFWKWFAAPGAAYVVERVTRLFRLERGKTYISSGILLASRVTHVVVRRPALFSFHAGDYVYVNVPAIAAYEWHPFTISSAPEQDEYLWLHIRGVGEWTNRLHRYFEDEHRRLRAAHPTISRTISSPDSKTHKKRSVDFSPLTFNNEAFTLEEETNKPAQHTSLLKAAHLPLEKSMSMPDVQHRTPKKERLSTPGGRDIAEARLAHSFRYLRAKPSFVAFHTPSFDAERGLIYSARRRLSKSISPDKEVEDPNANQTAPDDPPYAKPLEIYLDGPYGAPSSHIFAAQHAALIAAGIGVTPFASILQCIMHRYWNTRNVCPRCRHAWAGDAMAAMRLRKVDFFWINREQRSFEWFVSLLSQLEMEQAELGPSLERFLELHMYITSAFQRGDMRAVHLQLALDLLHEKEKRDLITGLKTRTNAGRPNWDKVFTQLQQQNKGKVTVFYCGPPQLGRVLRVKCDQYGFNFRKEVF